MNNKSAQNSNNYITHFNVKICRNGRNYLTRENYCEKNDNILKYNKISLK